MAVAHLLARPLAGVSYSLPLLFAAAILPDLDFLFSPLFAHHTITHSATFWLLAYAPVFAIFRWKAVPYAVATFSHFLIGDVLTGNPPLLFGISDVKFGIAVPWIAAHYGVQPAALYQSAVDVAASAIFAVTALYAKSVRPIWAGAYDPRHVLLLLAIVALIFFGALKNEMVTALRQPQETLYIPYALIALSHIVFILPFIRPAKKLQLPASAPDD